MKSLALESQLIDLLTGEKREVCDRFFMVMMMMTRQHKVRELTPTRAHTHQIY
jgi:hypothetical protein